MDNPMIRQLHRNIIREESYDDKISAKTKEAIKELLQEEESGESTECSRDKLLLAAAEAEENGFVRGFIYAFRLFSECGKK